MIEAPSKIDLSSIFPQSPNRMSIDHVIPPKVLIIFINNFIIIDQNQQHRRKIRTTKHLLKHPYQNNQPTILKLQFHKLPRNQKTTTIITNIIITNIVVIVIITKIRIKYALIFK